MLDCWSSPRFGFHSRVRLYGCADRDVCDFPCVRFIAPCTHDLLIKIAGNQQGFVAGMNSTYTSLGTIFGPALGGILFDQNIHFPFLFAGVVLFLGLTLIWKGR